MDTITYDFGDDVRLDRPFEGMVVREISDGRVTVACTYEGDSGFAVTVETPTRRRRIVRRSLAHALIAHQRESYRYRLAASPNLYDPPQYDDAPRVVALDKGLARREWRRYGRER